MGDVFEEEEEELEQTVTLSDYIKDMEEQELEADLVLGGDEGDECSYDKGYMKRQAVFSCLTCTPLGNAGVCAACCFTCHDGHEVVDLWTKRNFRCDCGNSKFGDFSCTLFPEKDSENGDNLYSHNFLGFYCTCGRRYPDPDSGEQAEMIQCCICEDWFHDDHLGLNSPEEVPRVDEREPLYSEFICQECAPKCSFLSLYPNSVWAQPQQVDNISANSNMNTMEDGNTSSKMQSNSISSKNLLADGDKVGSEALNSLVESESMSIANSDNCLVPNKEKAMDVATSSSMSCVLGIDLHEVSLALEKKPLFLVRSWRDHLCTCETCLKYYKEKNVNFLIDKDDSIEEYEKLAKKKREGNLQQQERAELKFLDKLQHVQKIEILNGIADMKTELQSFLESSDSSKPVTADDVRQMFDNLKKKRQRQRLQ